MEGAVYGPPVYLYRRLQRRGENGLVIIQKKVSGLSEAALAKFVTRAQRACGLQGAVSLLVTNKRELQRLNHHFRGKNVPTDVLSFPAMPGLIPHFAGDVAISAEIAAQNARRLGHSVPDEIRILALHAVLHLAGYDHELDDGEMEREEARLRKSLGLPSALIERNHSSTHGGNTAAQRRNRKPPRQQRISPRSAKSRMTTRAIERPR
jgi:probable rRNA maturation factor